MDKWFYRNSLFELKIVFNFSNEFYKSERRRRRKRKEKKISTCSCVLCFILLLDVTGWETISTYIARSLQFSGYFHGGDPEVGAGLMYANVHFFMSDVGLLFFLSDFYILLFLDCVFSSQPWSR